MNPHKAVRNNPHKIIAKIISVVNPVQGANIKKVRPEKIMKKSKCEH